MLLLGLKRLYFRFIHRFLQCVKKEREVNTRTHRPSGLLIDAWKEAPSTIKGLSPKNTYLVIDTETSSLSPKNGELLSVGWVTVANNKIHLPSARHYLLQTKKTVGDSASIHQIRDCELENGISKEVLMENLLEAAKGKIIVFHHAPLDIAFLNQACQEVYGLPLLWPTIDTLRIEKERLERRNIPLKPATLRLANCRTRYNLPTYPAHNALVDAIATAELLLAQLSNF